MEEEEASITPSLSVGIDEITNDKFESSSWKRFFCCTVFFRRIRKKKFCVLFFLSFFFLRAQCPNDGVGVRQSIYFLGTIVRARAGRGRKPPPPSPSRLNAAIATPIVLVMAADALSTIVTGGSQMTMGGGGTQEKSFLTEQRCLLALCLY